MGASETTRLLTADDGHPVAVEIQRASLHITAGPDAGQVAEITDRTFQVGTAAGNDLVLTDPTVSHYHMAISAETSGFVIRDRGSTNGTRVEGVRVREAFLKPSCTLQLGHTTVVFEALQERYSVPLSQREQLGSLLGRSAAMREVFSYIESHAPLGYNILIEGESGTGKEGAARALHTLGARPDGPLIIVDCSCLTDDLIEDALFGHVPGAFSGATAARRGAIACADGGTLFLDEIGELPLRLQAKLLRVLQERSFSPLGSDQTQRSDFRLVTATNRELRVEVNAGRFRDDLFYRLSTLRLHMPPLRDRRDDIPLLLEHFIRLEAAAAKLTQPFGLIPPEVVEALKLKPWRGNVRQLRSYAIALLIRRSKGPLLPGDYLAGDMFGAYAKSDATSEAATDEAHFENIYGEGDLYRAGKKRALLAYDLSFVRHVLKVAGGNISQAARLSGISRQQLGRIINRLGVNKEVLLERPRSTKSTIPEPGRGPKR